MEDRIKVLVKRIGQPARVEIIKNDFRVMQKIVGGNFEIPYNPNLPKGVDMVCNEEGKFLSLEPNIYWGDSDVIFGDIFFVGQRNGDHISITPKQIEQATKFIEENDASEYTGDPEDLAAVEFRTFDNDMDFMKALFGELFDEKNDIKPQFRKDDSDSNQMRQADFLDTQSKNPVYGIYQLKIEDSLRDYLFSSLGDLQERGLKVERGNYDLIYAAPYEGEHLEIIYQRFNFEHPHDFNGHSLSMSDIVVLKQDGNYTAHYVDTFGFKEIPDFMGSASAATKKVMEM